MYRVQLQLGKENKTVQRVEVSRLSDVCNASEGADKRPAEGISRKQRSLGSYSFCDRSKHGPPQRRARYPQ